MSQADEILNSLIESTHEHTVVDSDVLFTVDPFTRELSTTTGQKTVLMQGDHNSERFTFKIPRYIEGHDMALCNMIYVPYINIEAEGRDPKYKTGVYPVDDVQISEDSKYLTFSWLISVNATTYEGSLSFMLLFSCMTGKIIEYRWSTNSYNDILVLKSLDSNVKFETEYVDVIEHWKETVKTEFVEYLNIKLAEHVAVAKDELKQILADDFAEYSTKVDATLNSFDNILKKEITDMDEEINLLKSRMDNFAKLGEGSTTGDAELADIRIGANGEEYKNAGTAVREQFKSVKGQLDGIISHINPEIEIGTISEGAYGDTSIRARFVKPIKYHNATIFVSALSGYLFGYTVYDENETYDGADHGWNDMSLYREITLKGPGYVAMNFCRTDSAEITEDDLTAIASAIKIECIDILYQLDNIRAEMAAGFAVNESFEIEVGGVAGGEPVSMANRARFTTKIRVYPNTTITVSKNSIYMYGYNIYDTDGIYDGVDHGWNSMVNNNTIEFSNEGYIRMAFCRTDNASITDEDISALTSLITIVGREMPDDLINKVRQLREDVDDMAGILDRFDTSSIDIDYGRVNGASYIFARIPKTTNIGTSLRPKVLLSSPSGTTDANNLSALAYAKNNKTLFVMNAGLFNTTTKLPVGQTIIDGISITNEPMTDDMGSAISDSECYPLCIDVNGDLSAPYSRNIDTTDMITDGIIYAVTGWGKIIDNFVACSDTVENEIVHAGTYIRQVIGQFQNGDYFVCTVDKSRGAIENEEGITYEDLAQLLIDKGVKFAYSLDGGGSAETVIGVRQLNPIYEGSEGRPVPTLIVFEEA